MEQPNNVEVIDFKQMKKQSVTIDMNGRIVKETVTEIGSNPYEAAQKARRERFGF